MSDRRVRDLIMAIPLFFALLCIAAAESHQQEQTGKCRTVKETMLTCLEATAQDLPNTKQETVNWLLFVRSNFPSITRQMMKLYPALTDLHATNAAVETIQQDAFVDLKELNWIDLSYNKLTELDVDLLKEAKTFYYLNVSGNPDLVIPANAPFLNSQKMNWLDLSLCGIEKLYAETFTKLRGLKVLSLAGNKLTNLPEKVFQPLQNLYSLDLSNNQFRTVQSNIFKDMKHLSLYLARNPWECDCSLYPFIEWAKTRRLKDQVHCAKPEIKPWADVTGLVCESAMVQVF